MKETFKSGEEFGKNIRRVRTEKGMTLEEVGDKTELSQSYLSDVELGKIKSPGVDVVKRLAEALNISIDRLAGTKLTENGDDEDALGSKLKSEGAGVNQKMLEEALEYPATKVVVRAFADSEIEEEKKDKLDNLIGLIFDLALFS